MDVSRNELAQSLRHREATVIIIILKKFFNITKEQYLNWVKIAYLFYLITNHLYDLKIEQTKSYAYT